MGHLYQAASFSFGRNPGPQLHIHYVNRVISSASVSIPGNGDIGAISIEPSLCCNDLLYEL